MILNFKTKRDINGNTYWLFIDTDKHEYGDYRRLSEDEIEVTRKRMRIIRNNAKAEGYKEV